MGLFVSFLSHTDAGHNEFSLINGGEDAFLVQNVNVDGHGKETKMVGLMGMTS